MGRLCNSILDSDPRQDADMLNITEEGSHETATRTSGLSVTLPGTGSDHPGPARVLQVRLPAPRAGNHGSTGSHCDSDSESELATQWQ